MRLLLFPLLFSPVLATVSAQAPAVPAGQAHFNIVQANNGKTVGSTDCSVEAAASGYHITSHGDLKMTKFSYTFTNTNHLDSQLNIVHDELSGTVNGAQVTFNLGSDTSGRQFQVSIDASGKNTTNT